MRGTDDFMYILAAAILILVVFAVASVFVTTTGQDVEETTIASFTVGSVGFSQNLPSKSLTLGTFTVGESQFETLKSILQLEVTKGLSGERKEEMSIVVPKAFEDTTRNVRVTFSVFDTNNYGKLNVLWNGVTVYSGYPNPGPLSLTLDKDVVKNVNTLEFTTDGPGLYFWAQTVYVLKNVKVELDYGPDRIFPFELFSSELATFDRGELSFFGSGSGLLAINVNGQQLFSGAPTGVEEIPFELTDVSLKVGTNTLTFSSTGVTTIGGGQLNIFLLTSELSKAKTFDLTQEQAKQVADGHANVVLVYNVDEILKNGALSVTLNDKEFQLSSVVKGQNTVTFGAADVQEGKNTLIFSGTGNWEIGDASVLLQKA